MKPITNFDTLQARLKEAEAQQQISDDALRRTLGGWYLSAELFGQPPADPFSPAYRAFQLDIYEQLTHQQYGVANEETQFDFEHELRQPYPYGTRSGHTVGTHLMDYGWLLKKMNLAPEARVLEIGSGFGSLTMHLASLGYRVTCLDISARLLQFIETRTAGLPYPVETICGDMAKVAIPGRFDAVIFNASLHHSLAHRQVIERLKAHLEPGGLLAFTAEPIVRRGTRYVPYPWGIRLDGLSVWSIVKWGWLELGFQEGYFTRVLREAGWELIRYYPPATEMAEVWLAHRDATHLKRPFLRHPVYKYRIDSEALLNSLLRKMLGGLTG